MAIPIDEKSYGGGMVGLSIPRFVSPKLKIISGIFLIITIILSVVSGFEYYWLKVRLQGEINSLKNQVEAIDIKQKTLQTQQFIVVQSQLRSLRSILENHIYATNLFKFLESVAHPKTRFIGLGADLNERVVKVRVEAASFTVVAEQLKILESSPLVERFSTSDFNTGQKGEINFNLDVILKKDAFRK